MESKQNYKTFLGSPFCFREIHSIWRLCPAGIICVLNVFKEVVWNPKLQLMRWRLHWVFLVRRSALHKCKMQEMEWFVSKERFCAMQLNTSLQTGINMDPQPDSCGRIAALKLCSPRKGSESPGMSCWAGGCYRDIKIAELLASGNFQHRNQVF